MRITKMMVGSLGGAALMYFLDPNEGRRRRAMLRDQVEKFMNTAADRTEGMIENISDRAQGIAAEKTRTLTSEEVSDEVMVARVRSAMGHVLSSAHNVEVIANNGLVTLSGSVPTQEVDTLISTVKALPGVHGVDNRLEMYEDAANMS